MESEPDLATVEVPPGRVLRCGAARPGGVTGTMRWPRGRGQGPKTGPGDPHFVALTRCLLLPQCPGTPRRPVAVSEAAPALPWAQGLPPRRLGGPGRAAAPVPSGALAAAGRGARGALVRGVGRTWGGAGPAQEGRTDPVDFPVD